MEESVITTNSANGNNTAFGRYNNARGGRGRGSAGSSYAGSPRYPNPRNSPENNNGDNNYGTSYTRLTATGFEHPVKSAILDRFHEGLAMPAHGSELSSFSDIWIPTLQPPISFEPLTEEEQVAIQSGYFTATQKKHPQSGATRGGSTQAARGAGRGGRRGGNQGGGYGGHGYQHSHEQSEAPPRTRKGFSGNDDEHGNSDEEILWASASLDSTLGTFDDKGNFTMADGSNHRHNTRPASFPATEEPQSQSVTLSFFGSIPTTLGRPQATSLATAPPVVAPTQAAEVRWFYRDPTGQIQGPFNSKKMLNWYNRKYFPETLPLRREEDFLFESLSSWKIKCRGICPFEMYLEQEDLPPMSGLSLSPPAPSTLPTAKPVLDTNPIETIPNSTASILAKLGLPWQSSAGENAKPVSTPLTSPPSVPVSIKQETPSLGEEQLRFLEQLNKKSAYAVEPNIEQQSPSVVSPWRQFEKNSIDLEQELLKPKEQPKPVSTKPVTTAFTPAAGAFVATSPTAMTSPLDLAPATAPSVSWSKPTTPAAKPLDEILREEAEAEVIRRQANNVRSVSGGPKSFADLVKLAGAPQAATSQQAATVIVSPSTTTAPLTKLYAHATPTPSTKSLIPNATSPITNDSASAPEDLKAWCMNQLKPLAPGVDITICTLLLTEQRTPQEVMAFVEDNLRSAKIDVSSFAREFIKRKFHTTISTEDDADFVIVSRDRRPRKK